MSVIHAEDRFRPSPRLASDNPLYDCIAVMADAYSRDPSRAREIMRRHRDDDGPGDAA